MIVVLDTNILVSALITPFGNAARILDLVLRDDIRLLYDDRILSEYREVLLRPKFGFNTSYVDILIDYLEAEGIRITPSVINEPLVDKDDIPFLEVAISGKADALITDNKRHFKTRTAKRLKITNPEEFLEMWSKFK
ncbi:MAG: putative toxin-antitoxin system toxin component, PIN family [Thermodesulfovibrionales bacterium]